MRTRARAFPLWLVSLSLLVPATILADTTAATDTEPDAVWLRQGSVANRQIVAIGRDLVIDGEALQNAAALQGDVFVGGTVRGDVIALGGDVTLSAGSRVVGDVYALGGRLEMATGASVGGRAAAYPDAPATLLVLLEGPAVGLGAFSKPVLAAKTAALLGWLILSVLVVVFSPTNALSRTRDVVLASPLRAFLLGTVALASVVVGVVLFSAFAPVTIGLPVLGAALLLAVALKVWGTVAMLEGVGRFAAARMGLAAVASTHLVLGVISLGLVKFVPYVGTVVWSALTLIAVGASIASRFGARDLWIPE